MAAVRGRRCKSHPRPLCFRRMAGYDMIIELSPRKQKGINAILCSPTISEAAKASGVSERTMRRWLADPTFRYALNESQGETVRNTSRLLMASEIQAVKTLNGLLEEPSQPGANVKLHTAIAILDQSSRRYESASLEERLEKLEKAIRDEG